MSSRTNSVIEKPTLKASARTVRLVEPLSRIKKKRAEPRLPMMRMKPMATMIFMTALGVRHMGHMRLVWKVKQDSL